MNKAPVLIDEEKWTRFREESYYPLLSPATRRFLDELAGSYRLTFQEFRQLTEMARDLFMWGERPLEEVFASLYPDGAPAHKKEWRPRLLNHYQTLKNAAKDYNAVRLKRPKKREKGKIRRLESDKKIFGMCPVASPKTVCCNLKTIDAVENCVFGCSYCTIQTFYHQETVFDAHLSEKLEALSLDPARRYHIGTGQSSDSLVWGNKHGNLDALMRFARSHPNVLLEFKTKSDNIRYFLEHDIPPNIVCSWSLNPQVIIENEEHFTAGLEQRLSAARRVADRGIRVAFHFHPIIYYNTWQEDYTRLAQRVLEMFTPEEVLFISFGSVTFIKPVLKQIRRSSLETKITQMELVKDPHGKLTYPDVIKIEKFSTMYRAFEPWHDEVFFYLCMEKAELWERSLGFVFESNDAFEQAMLDHCFARLPKK
ncbi:MAG: DNA photolyase [Calditrichaeota bacterium]|nr:MAG: DNA photolyase [Calditrichota bacterium]